jgi:hypothetical protein
VRLAKVHTTGRMGGIPFRAGEYDLALISVRPLREISRTHEKTTGQAALMYRAGRGRGAAQPGGGLDA